MKATKSSKVERLFSFNQQKAVNNSIKEYHKTVGGCVSQLRNAINEGAIEIDNVSIVKGLLIASKKQSNYKELQKVFKPNVKSGKYNVWTLLGVLGREGYSLKDKFAANAKNAANKAVKELINESIAA